MDTLDVLREARATGEAATGFGGIDPAFADALYHVVLREHPVTCVEIGLANGLSALAILGALDPGARLISIDPYQSTFWQNRAVEAIARAGLSEQHTLIESPDYLALPELLRDGTTIDFAYIDGWHTFDYTLLDFFYLDKMLRVGGVVAFNDCGLRAVHRVVRFLTTNRHYEELDVGLPQDYTTNLLVGVRRRLEGRNAADRYFRKLDAWEPESSSYHPF